MPTETKFGQIFIGLDAAMRIVAACVWDGTQGARADIAEIVTHGYEIQVVDGPVTLGGIWDTEREQTRRAALYPEMLAALKAVLISNDNLAQGGLFHAWIGSKMQTQLHELIAKCEVKYVSPA